MDPEDDALYYTVALWDVTGTFTNGILELLATRQGSSPPGCDTIYLYNGEIWVDGCIYADFQNGSLCSGEGVLCKRSVCQ